jgi:hypothetical protein
MHAPGILAQDGAVSAPAQSQGTSFCLHPRAKLSISSSISTPNCVAPQFGYRDTILLFTSFFQVVRLKVRMAIMPMVKDKSPRQSGRVLRGASSRGAVRSAILLSLVSIFLMAYWLLPISNTTIVQSGKSGAASSTASDMWYPPGNTKINNLTEALTGTGTKGFIYDSSHTPDELYGTYNWCNMPHVRAKEYPRASSDFELQYVEVVSSLP